MMPSPYLVTITKYTHFFKVTQINPRITPIVFQFVRQYMQVAFQRGRPRPGVPAVPPDTKVFGAANKSRSEFRFHINSFSKFLEHLKMNQVHDHNTEIVIQPVIEAGEIELLVREGWVPKPEQLPVLNYLADDTRPRSKFVGLATGSGKTVISSMAIAGYKKRTVVLVKPQFMGKWVKDIHKILDVATAEIITINGGKELRNYLYGVSIGTMDSIKVVILSNRTWQNWLKDWETWGEETKDLGYMTFPEEFYTFIDAGTRLIDEVHMDFHLNFRSDLYTHVQRSVALSATLLNLDPFTERMYRLAYPVEERFDAPPPERFTRMVGMIYRLKQGRKISTTYDGTTYSHTAYEESIMKNREFLDSYMSMVGNIMAASYVKERVEGKRLIVFAASVDMCTHLVKYIRARFPQFSCERYVADDPDENLYDPDIRVTTILSGGTAHDITDLSHAIMTISIKSIQSNIQAFGRLRKLLCGTPTWFYFLTCEDVPKQVTYHIEKVEHFENRALSYTPRYYQQFI